MINVRILQVTTRKVLLENMKHTDRWSTQGLGMMRLYLDDAHKFRLHIWDESLAAEGATQLHTHPWGFKSTVVCGMIKDYTYYCNGTDRPDEATLEDVYTRHKIRCGEGGGLTGDTRDVVLKHWTGDSPTVYVESSSYVHGASDIHYTEYQDGTVTLIERFFGEDTEHAYVYERRGKEFGSAEPRQATRREIDRVVENAVTLLNRSLGQ